MLAGVRTCEDVRDSAGSSRLCTCTVADQRYSANTLHYNYSRQPKHITARTSMARTNKNNMTAEINVFSVFIETLSVMKQTECHLEDCSTAAEQQKQI